MTLHRKQFFCEQNIIFLFLVIIHYPILNLTQFLKISQNLTQIYHTFKFFHFSHKNPIMFSPHSIFLIFCFTSNYDSLNLLMSPKILIFPSEALYKHVYDGPQVIKSSKDNFPYSSVRSKIFYEKPVFCFEKESSFPQPKTQPSFVITTA